MYCSTISWDRHAEPVQTLGEVAAHTVCRRQRIVKLGELRFKTLKLFHQHIEVVVRNRRIVLYIVFMIMIIDQPAQSVNLFFGDGIYQDSFVTNSKKFCTNLIYYFHISKKYSNFAKYLLIIQSAHKGP